MTREDFIKEFHNLIEAGEITTVEDYRYKKRMSRTTAEKELRGEEWAEVEYCKGRFIFVKK